MNTLPVIAITMGDPAGIGPELAVRAADDFRWSDRCRFVIYGEPSILAEAARRWTDRTAFPKSFQPGRSRSPSWKSARPPPAAANSPMTR